MDILYTANKKYIDVMLASIYSVCLNGKLDKINLHIVYSDFNIDDILYVENVLCTLNNVSFNFYYFADEELDRYEIPRWKGSHIASARLFFQSILKDKMPSKLLYVDSDTICIGDLRDLEKLDDYPIYAVKDILHRCYTQRFSHLKQYYNSGVLYIDTNKWQKIDAEGKIVDFIRKSPWELVYPDQDILNCAMDNYIKEMSPEYNYPPHPFIFSDEDMRRYHFYRNISAEELLEAKNKVKICHSYGISNIKPWTKNNINPYNDLFMKYIMMVNPDFKKDSIPLSSEILTRNKKFYCAWLILRNHLSSLMVVEQEHKRLSKDLKQKNHFN